MPVAAIYARVSSDGQAGEDKVSIPNQIEDCRKLARSQGHEVPTEFVFEEVFSGAADRRPTLDRLLIMVPDARAYRAGERAPFQRLYCWDATRLSRGGMRATLEIVDRFAEGGVEVHCVKDGPLTDELSVGVKGWAARYERENFQRRVREGKKLRRERGEWVSGGPPFGYRVDYERRLLRPCGFEAPIVRRIFDMAGTGLGPIQIARRLNADGTPAPEALVRVEGREKRVRLRPRGRPLLTVAEEQRLKVLEIVKKPEWNAGTVKKILTNPAMMGVQLYGPKGKREPFPVNIEPAAIISESEFRRVNEMRTARKDKAPGKAASAEWLLSGLLRCGSCGSAYIHSARGPKGGHAGSKRYHYYRCAGRTSGKQCKSPYIRVEVAHGQVIDACRRHVAELLGPAESIVEHLLKLSGENLYELQGKLEAANQRARDARDRWRKAEATVKALAEKLTEQEGGDGAGGLDEDLPSLMGDVRDARRAYEKAAAEAESLSRDLAHASEHHRIQREEAERIARGVMHASELEVVGHFDPEDSASKPERSVLTDVRAVIREIVERVVVLSKEAVTVHFASSPEKRLRLISHLASQVRAEVEVERQLAEDLKKTAAEHPAMVA